MRTYITKGSTEYWRAIVTLFLGSVAAFGAEYCLQPIIPVLAKEFELLPATASLAMSFGTGGMAFAMIGIASFAARLERKKVMTVAIIIAALLAIGMAISSSFHLILVLRLLQGILLAGFPALAIAYINEEFDPKIIGLVVGIYVSANSLGGLSGRLLISTLTDYFSWRVGLGFAGFLYFLVGVAFWFILPNSTKQIEKGRLKLNILEDFKKILSNKKLVALYVIAFAVMGSFVCVYNFISYVFIAPPYNLSQTIIGFIFMLYLLGTVSSTVMGGLSDRYGHGKVMCLSCLIMLTGIIMTLTDSLAWKVIGLGGLTYGFFGTHCNACAWAAKLAKGDKAQASSIYMLFYYMGASIIGTLGGTFLTVYGWDGVVGFVGTIVLVALLLSLRLTVSELPMLRAVLHKNHL
jgi:YNFM family putative membrane transporter